MLQCPRCLRWFHRAFGGVRSVSVTLDCLVLWCIYHCCARLSRCFPNAYTPPATVRGPMALALLGRCQILIYLFLGDGSLMGGDEVFNFHSIMVGIDVHE
jgi:hypothetical protein